MKGAERLQSMKASAHRRDFRIEVGGGFTLQPVITDLAHLDPQEVRCVTEWRNRHVQSFLHEFTATTERTARWLTQRVGPDETHVLFMLRDSAAEIAGYLGLGYIDWARQRGEADAIVRGRELPSGTMKRALQQLLAWARQELGLSEMGVRVLSDNPACEFYRKCGFVEIRREPLAARQVDDGQIWEVASTQAPSRWLVHFRYDAI